MSQSRSALRLLLLLLRFAFFTSTVERPLGRSLARVFNTLLTVHSKQWQQQQQRQCLAPRDLELLSTEAAAVQQQ